MSCMHCESKRVLAEEEERPADERCFDTMIVARINAAKPCTDK